jgi:hypothetical protein
MGGFIQGITDTFTSLVGGKTSAEKAAKSAQDQQAASLMSIQSEQAKALEERKKRMNSKSAGRGSLLSGTEAGVTSDTPLAKTLG